MRPSALPGVVAAGLGALTAVAALPALKSPGRSNRVDITLHGVRLHTLKASQCSWKRLCMLYCVQCSFFQAGEQ